MIFPYVHPANDAIAGVSWKKTRRLCALLTRNRDQWQTNKNTQGSGIISRNHEDRKRRRKFKERMLPLLFAVQQACCISACSFNKQWTQLAASRRNAVFPWQRRRDYSSWRVCTRRRRRDVWQERRSCCPFELYRAIWREDFFFISGRATCCNLL